ncbi:uncharacterized protein LOC123533600 [Mercenaria mercenaria]|uniref:uncharacterized protein LOC123533600 n=1 Tax=Mercenaria mercenaria TaxID=6596 RepID=UPI00234E60AB|nr:uncharacterized protein LOC123533600 [Mercenaria mercenaria]
MNCFDQKKITKNLMSIQRALKDDVNYITDKLYEQKVFSSEVRREIQEMKCRLPQLQCAVFVNHLLRSGKDSYKTFKNILIDMGHHEIVSAMENSGPTANIVQWTEERGKTFVLPDLKIPDRMKKQGRIDENDKEMLSVDSKMEDVQQLERLATFVLTKLDCKNKNNNTVNFNKELKQTLEEVSEGNEELNGLFKTLNFNRFSLTSESLAH